jgi:hypothetical protein
MCRKPHAEIIKSPSTIERQQAELLHGFEGAARKLKVGLAVSFLTPAFKVKLIGVLMQISESVQCMITVLKSSNTNEYTETESEECSEEDPSKEGSSA